MSNLLPEQQARQSIDQQLEAAGWAVQDVKEINLQAQSGTAQPAPFHHSLFTLQNSHLPHPLVTAY